MSEEQTTDNADGEITTPDQKITFHSHYVKDLSFENPNAPHIYNDPSAAPQVSVNFSVSSRPIPDKNRHYEVELMIKASALQGEQTMFLAELSFGGEVSVAPDMEERAIHPVVMIEGPRFLFPFARALMSNITRDGGFMPLNIQPIDFIQLYQMRMQQQQEAQQQAQQENQD
jgi:preprotein translocase subunit SecB